MFNFVSPLSLCPADDERHDVYLTLQQGVFGRGNKRADKNVQVDVEVLGERGETLPVSSSEEKGNEGEREREVRTIKECLSLPLAALHMPWSWRGEHFSVHLPGPLSFVQSSLFRDLQGTGICCGGYAICVHHSQLSCSQFVWPVCYMLSYAYYMCNEQSQGVILGIVLAGDPSRQNEEHKSTI